MNKSQYYGLPGEKQCIISLRWWQSKTKQDISFSYTLFPAQFTWKINLLGYYWDTFFHSAAFHWMHSSSFSNSSVIHRRLNVIPCCLLCCCFQIQHFISMVRPHWLTAIGSVQNTFHCMNGIKGNTDKSTTNKTQTGFVRPLQDARHRSVWKPAVGVVRV